MFSYLTCIASFCSINHRRIYIFLNRVSASLEYIFPPFDTERGGGCSSQNNFLVKFFDGDGCEGAPLLIRQCECWIRPVIDMYRNIHNSYPYIMELTNICSNDTQVYKLLPLTNIVLSVIDVLLMICRNGSILIQDLQSWQFSCSSRAS